MTQPIDRRALLKGLLGATLASGLKALPASLPTHIPASHIPGTYTPAEILVTILGSPFELGDVIYISFPPAAKGNWLIVSRRGNEIGACRV